jgi:phage terminase large subunit
MAKRQMVSAGKGVINLNLGTLYPKQAEFYNSKALYTAFGGARGPGKTHACRITAVDGALRYNGIKILIIRRTYPDLQNNIIDPLLLLVGPLISAGVASYNGSLHVLKFDNNNSTIRFGHFAGVSSESEYRGQEYDWIFIDEATQFTEQEFRILGGCLRGVNNIPKRFFLTCNPGGVGHRWVKRLFIDKDYKTNCANPEENENPNDYKFIQHLLRITPRCWYPPLLTFNNLPRSLRICAALTVTAIGMLWRVHTSLSSRMQRTLYLPALFRSIGRDTGRLTTA